MPQDASGTTVRDIRGLSGLVLLPYYCASATCTVSDKIVPEFLISWSFCVLPFAVLLGILVLSLITFACLCKQKIYWSGAMVIYISIIFILFPGLSGNVTLNFPCLLASWLWNLSFSDTHGIRRWGTVLFYSLLRISSSWNDRSTFSCHGWVWCVHGEWSA